MADADSCSGEPANLSHRGLRIGSIFIIMAASLVGALLPVFLSRQHKMHVPKFTFFICKYVGTGVIIATAWMHLLDPAIDNLSDPCLEARLGDYPWALAIGLMTVMVMFFVELLAARIAGEDDDAHHSHAGSDGGSDPATLRLTTHRPPTKGSSSSSAGEGDGDGDGEGGGDGRRNGRREKSASTSKACPHDVERDGGLCSPDPKSIPGLPDDVSYPPGGEDHLAHGREHKEGDEHNGLAGQLTALFILEFGVVFHSVFIGLTLGTTQDLVLLLIVLVFHQMFEGLGLGSRLATAPWPRDKQWLPYVLALAFALSSPVGIAAGIGARPSNANTQKLVNGIFDAISAGILMYTGLVELLAHEFMFNPHMRKAPLKIQLFAFGCVCFGVAVMALLAKWA
ncbi:Zinc-regulated transporter 2 [Escovopsis weberi]|uniref:Zinc-regulated transporter 2 n=1 Tax=Escovopsis weberi TaxID=150374 RepID=A0A0M8MYJ3_ESCWE|nr:Zinc-regulated transporter 2 [Escovopsis weberi]